MSYRRLDDNLMEEIANLDSIGQGAWLYLVAHNEFPGAWLVDSLDPSFQFDFEDLIGHYRVLWPASLDQFKQRCDHLGYQIAFIEDPAAILESYERLQDTPPIRLKSNLDGTRNGFLSWQVQGFNKLIVPERRAGLCFWDTGTGKTAFIASAILWHMAQDAIEFALVVVKSNNKRDMQRKLQKLGGIESTILDGTPIKRAKFYEEIAFGPTPRTLIMNYEKFREDQEFLEALVTNRRVAIFWDEMPTKLSNRGTQLYSAVRDVIYEPPENPFFYGAISWDRKRPSWLKQYELTATPVEKDPGGQFSCVRLLDPDALGTVTTFEKEHVLARNPLSHKPIKWHKLDLMSNRLEFMMHRVDKTSPEVSRYFPNIIEDHVTIDWSLKHWTIYQSLQKQAALMAEEDERVNILSLIMVMQMLCDAPSMVVESAANRTIYEAFLDQIESGEPISSGVIKQGSEMALRLVSGVRKKLDDTGHTKIERLREDLTVRHPDAKVLLFSTWGDYIFPVLERELKKWGVSYEVYRGTDKQRLAAKDIWRSDPRIRVLVCSDAGSDSIDLPEANLVINYNLPWLYSRLYQRIHRASRADSTHEKLYVISYTMAESVEERRLELIEERFGYHQGVLGTAVKVAESSTLSRADLLYLLGINQ